MIPGNRLPLRLSDTPRISLAAIHSIQEDLQCNKPDIRSVENTSRVLYGKGRLREGIMRSRANAHPYA